MYVPRPFCLFSTAEFWPSGSSWHNLLEHLGMATDSILGIPESIQKLMSSKSSYDEKLSEQLKAINNTLFDYASKYGIPQKRLAAGKAPLPKKSGNNEPHIDPPQLNSGWPALLKASYRGDFEKVKHLITSGKCDVNVMAEDGSFALMVASSMGHANIVKFLIEHGSEVDAGNTSNFTALMRACKHGHYEVVKLLLAHGAEPNMQTSSLELGDPTITALMLAVSSNRYEIVKLLLDNGAKPNMQCDITTVSALVIATISECYNIAELLLENGADPNTKLKETTVLVIASNIKFHKMVKLLLDKGAQVNMPDKNGRSALMAASHEGYYNTVKILLEYGASVNLKMLHGGCALIFACTGGHHQVAALLLKRGAQVDMLDDSGETALSSASTFGHYQVVQLLLKNGAQPNLQNHAGLSALGTACISGHYDIAKLLIEKGAKVDMIDTEVKVTTGLPVHISIVAVAASAGYYNIVKLLLDNGAQPNTTCKNRSHSALTLASMQKHCYQVHVDIGKLLLDYGADPNRLDNGNYSLHYVVKIRDTRKEFIKLLLSRGALPSLRNGKGYSALTEATLARCNENVEILLESPLVGKADLWQTLKIAVNSAGYFERAIVLLYKRCVQIITSNNRVLLSFHGVVFWDAPIHHCITSQGATIQSPHTGISLSIPEQTLSSTEKDVDLLIHPCLNCPFELPAGYESASPAYLIQPSRRVKFHRDATLRIHHYASLQSEEDCDEMSFLSASPTPQYRQSKPVYIFEEIKHRQGSFRPNSHIGEITLQHFCFTKVGRKRKSNPQAESSACKKKGTSLYYSARLYRATSPQDLSGVTAVFCMCLYQPLYIKHCDRRIAEEYGALSYTGKARSDFIVQVTADEVTLSVFDSEGWNITFDKKPTKIRKRDMDLPNLFDVDLSELTDYPPKFSIFAHPTHKATESVTPQLVVEGLDVECSFKIIIPNYSCGRTASLSPAPSHHSQSSGQAGCSFTSRFEAEVHVEEINSLNLGNILLELVSINKEWSSLAIVLGLEHHEVEKIETDYPNNVNKRKEEVIARWLRTGCRSWQALCDALKSDLVKHSAIAEKIETKYNTNAIANIH